MTVASIMVKSNQTAREEIIRCVYPHRDFSWQDAYTSAAATDIRCDDKDAREHIPHFTKTRATSHVSFLYALRAEYQSLWYDPMDLIADLATSSSTY